MQFRLTQNTVTPELQRIINTVKRPVALMQAGAKTTQVELSKHLKKLQARGNKRGWPSQGFFAGKPNSVEKHVGIAKITDKGFIVEISDPRFIHYIAGGTVTAKRAKILAIPLTAEAYAASGKGSIKESKLGLKVIVFKRGAYLCREVATQVGGNKVKSLRVIPLFKLVRSVTHSPHPEAMPDLVALGEKVRVSMFLVAKIIFKAE